MTKLYHAYMVTVEEQSFASTVKLSYFRFIFQTNFNITFKIPQQDACSTCLQYNERLKNFPRDQVNSEEYMLLAAQKAIHKKRAKAFYSILKAYEPETFICSYDCQKNLPLPKIPDGATYYSRQLCFQNLTVVNGNSHTELTPDNVTSFCWTENQYSRDLNLISSCVLHNLRQVQDWSPFRHVIMVSDGCAGQNKNIAMITMCAFWLLYEAPCHIDEI